MTGPDQDTEVASTGALVIAVVLTMAGGLLSLVGAFAGGWLTILGAVLFVAGVVMVVILSFLDARRTNSSAPRALGRALRDGLRWLWQMAP